MLGAFLCARAVLPGMLERGRGRIVNTGSGAAYLPGLRSTAYAASKAARLPLRRGAREPARGRTVRVFTISPGLVRTEMTGAASPTTRRGRRRSCAPQLVRVLLSGRVDALAGRYLHAEHDAVDDLSAAPTRSAQTT